MQGERVGVHPREVEEDPGGRVTLPVLNVLNPKIESFRGWAEFGGGRVQSPTIPASEVDRPSARSERMRGPQINSKIAYRSLAAACSPLSLLHQAAVCDFYP